MLTVNHLFMALCLNKVYSGELLIAAVCEMP